jgi:diguanylate cyclase (GGDEF)-like protein/PAS domain S-box-containing protein
VQGGLAIAGLGGFEVGVACHPQISAVAVDCARARCAVERRGQKAGAASRFSGDRERCAEPRCAAAASCPAERLLARHLTSLKSQIVALAVCTGFAAALGAALLSLEVTQKELRQQLLDAERRDRERTAALFGSKLETLKSALKATAERVGRKLWDDPQEMGRFLLDKPGLQSLFDSVLAAAPDGRMLARVERGQLATELPNIGDRAYFRQAMAGDQPVVSEPLRGKVSKQPLIVVAVPVLDSHGAAIGIVAGALRLQSNSLFADPAGQRGDDVRDLVIDRGGVVLWHADPARVLGSARDEPGFGAVLARWSETGAPIDTMGSAEFSQDHLVSTAGIPLSDWLLVRLAPTASALAPLAVAHRAAWAAAFVAGLIAALLAGAVAWRAVKPIGSLRNRVERLILEQDLSADDWPEQSGEIGAMSRAFRMLLQLRQRQRTEMQAVLDNADVGLALTRSGRFELVSRQFCALFGYAPEQLTGEATCVIHGSQDAYDAFCAVASPAFLQHGQFDGELPVVHRDGKPFWVRMRGRAVAPGDRTQGTIWVVMDVTAERSQRESLNWAASHDALTGLANRATFEALLEQATRQAAHEPFCALFVDLDCFKQVNDSAGHAAGDALLRELAQLFTSLVRKTDTVARLGGDEFAVLLPQCPPSQAQALAEKLRHAVAEHTLMWQGRRFSVGASVGMVAADGSHTSAAAVLGTADAACYASKRAGRNRVTVALA